MKLKDLKVLLVDCQTTGMRPPAGRLLELAWSVVSATDESPPIEAHLVQLPEGEEVPHRVSEITGIKDLSSAKPEEDVYQAFAAAAGSVAVIHYAQFERPFLLDLYQRLGAAEELPFQVICSHQLTKRLFPNLPSQNIRGVAGFFGDPLDHIKRAGGHVQATHQIWRGLIAKLEEQGIDTLEALNEFLAQPFKKKKDRYVYKLDPNLRLKLPDSPGVYRMLAKSGEVLYVGKATSLKSRVNSYFRGQKDRDRRKLEMLAQVWNLDVTSCRTPLEAALLETDEIKRLNPPYNVVMKRGKRQLAFYTRDFSSVSRMQSESHPIGPFRGMNWMEHLRMIDRSLRSEGFEQVFFNPIDEPLLRVGFEMFRRAHALPHDLTVRKMLAYGLSLYRNYEEPEEELEEEEEAAVDEHGERIYTAEELSEKFERLFRRAGHEYWRARQMTRLLNSHIEIDVPGGTHALEFRGGRMNGEPMEPSKHPWQGLDIETFDRMSVLLSELAKYEHRVARI